MKVKNGDSLLLMAGYKDPEEQKFSSLIHCDDYPGDFGNGVTGC